MKFLAFILLCCIAIPSRAQIAIAAASDLRDAMDEIAARFESEYKAHVTVSYGSSANFYQQLQNGAPFDLFFSANTEYPKKLQSAGLVAGDSYYEYARGRIVLLVSSTSKLDLTRGLSVLLDPAVKKIAIADPSHAPYGQAAVAALKSQGFYDRVSGKLVTGENISQAASFVLSGAADVGIVAKSLVVSPKESNRSRYIEIPASTYPPIQQACVILKSAKRQKLAREFESFVQQSASVNIFKKYGFEVPDSRTKSVQ